MAQKQKRDLDATKEALLKAAKELMITCTDSDDVTSRKIAAKAQVNPAMINYCYGSRENLLYEVFKQLLADAQNVRPELTEMIKSDIPAKQHLIMLHFGMMAAPITLNDPRRTSTIVEVLSAGSNKYVVDEIFKLFCFHTMINIPIDLKISLTNDEIIYVNSELKSFLLINPFFFHYIYF